MRRFILLTSGLVVSVVLVGVPIAGAAGTAGALYRESIATAHHQTSVHFVVQSTGGGEDDTTIGDAGANTGRQQITFLENGKSGKVEVLLVKDVAYIRGNDNGLVDMRFGVPAAAKAAGKWVSVPKKDPGYAGITDGITFATVLTAFKMKPPFSFGRTSHRGGETVIDLHGTFGNSKTPIPVNYFVGVANHLPEGYQVSEVHSGQKMSGKVSLSNWSEKVHLTAPKGAVAISTFGL